MKTWTVCVFILSLLGQLFATYSFITEDFLGGLGAEIMSFILTLSLLLLYIDSNRPGRKNKMNQAKADIIFDAWPELDSLFSTSDGRCFIRYNEEAVLHADGRLDENTVPLKDKTIIQWFRQYK